MSAEEDSPIDPALLEAELAQPLDRRLLEEPSVHLPPESFSERVQRARVLEPKRRVGMLAALAACAALLAVGLFVRTGRERSGSVQATLRQSIDLGSRGVAVLEAGADLQWRVVRGEAEIEQRAGSVFYRVERGGAFRVHTRAGTVAVRGTCFTVEVEEMRLGTQGFVGAGVGAALATAVLVTVHEGHVSFANERGELQLAAGGRARAEAGSAPKISHATSTPTEPATDATLAALDHEALAQRASAQQAELATLRARVHALENAESATNEAPKHAEQAAFLHPSPEELNQLARECKLRWDEPYVGLQPKVIGPDRIAELGITDEERQAMNRLNADYNGKSLAELRALYVELTGDSAGADQLGPGALIEEIDEKSPRPDVQAAYEKLARERAGLQSAPTDARGSSVIERLMRLRTSAGDRYERALGAAIGPDLAKRMREEKDGFGSHSTSSHGCPGSGSSH
jgi:hypothetical protein